MLKQNKYNAKNTIQIPFRLNRRTDADIIGFFEVLKKYNISIAGYIKRIIRRDIEDIENNKNAAEKELEKIEAYDSELYNFIKDIKEI